MPVNNNQKEYIDIPLNIEQTPLHLFEKLQKFDIPVDPIEMGLDLLTHIDSAIHSSNCSNELLSIYFNFYEVANTKLGDKEWPAVHQIQQQYEDKDFSAKIQALYNELRLRSRFEKARKGETADFVDAAEEAWENYESILERESKEVSFPPIVAWEIIESFLDQLSKYHQIVPSLDKPDEDIFNLDRAKKLLEKLVTFIPAEPSKSPTSKQTFGYFSLLGLATIEVYSGHYREALNILARVSLQHLSAYSRSIGALLSLFLTISYAYFMLEQYKESARVTEMILLFFQKNKKYFTGVTGQHITARLFQKLGGLLCLDYTFLQQKPKPIIMQIFKTTTIKLKQKLQRQKICDKYYKLKQNDQGTFTKLYQHCSFPSIGQDNLKVGEIVQSRFKKIQDLTLNTILQHYTQISVEKIAKMLKITEKEVMGQIESFNNISGGSAAWDRTVMEPLLSQTRKLYVEVEEGMVKLDTDETNASEDVSEWEQYRQEISWLVEKVDAL